MVARAQHLLELYSDMGVRASKLIMRLPATWQGIQAAGKLEQQGIATQVFLVHRCGCLLSGVPPHPSSAAHGRWQPCMLVWLPMVPLKAGCAPTEGPMQRPGSGHPCADVMSQHGCLEACMSQGRNMQHTPPL
jgi:hypothetical protein